MRKRKKPQLKFDIEDIVVLKTDPERLPRIITRFTVSVTSISYELACGDSTSWHFDIEIEELSTNRKILGYANKK